METLEERVAAAEKTVAVLKRRVRELSDGEATSHLQRQLERSRRRAEDVARRRELADLRNRELQRYSAALELEVRSRTIDLHTILDNVDSGFLLVDAQARVQPGFSKSCAALLNTAQLAGKPLHVLLAASPDKAAWLQLAVSQAFADELPEDVALAQIPQRHVVGERVLRLVPRVVRDAGRVQRILVTLNDVTALEAARSEARTNQMLVSILAQREAFAMFITEAHTELVSVHAQIQDQGVVRRAVHTLKGNAASWSIDAIVDVCHRVESGSAIVVADLAAIADAFRGFLLAHRGLLSLTWDEDTGERYAVDAAQMSALEEIAREAGDARDGLATWTARLVMKRAGDVIGPIGSFVERLAARLGKSVAFELAGADTLLDVRRLRPIVAVLPHLLRNALDHGVEPPEERGSKPARATVRLSIADESNGWRLVVEDDGRGIDTAVVQARAVAMGALSHDELAGLDEDDVVRLICIDGLSTADVTTDVSGRGAGMSAIREAVQRLGGQLSIWTESGVGTRIALRIPRADAPAAARSRGAADRAA